MKDAPLVRDFTWQHQYSPQFRAGPGERTVNPMPEATAPDVNVLKLTFLRDIVQSARDPEAESFPLMQLAQSIINAAMTPAMVRERLGIDLG